MHTVNAGRSGGHVRRRGFTLIELLVVMAVLGILAATIMPLGETMVRAQKERRLRAALWEIRSAIDEHKRLADKGIVAPGPTGSGYPANLRMLVDGVEDLRPATRGHKLYFLRQIPRDPMAPDGAAAEATWRLRSHASPPDDPRPGADVFDVRSASDALALDGTPYASW